MYAFEIACIEIDKEAVGVKDVPSFQDITYEKSIAQLRSNFAHALRVFAACSKHPFHLMQDIGEPAQLYYIGKWDSVNQYAAFEKSEKRQELVDKLEQCHGKIMWRGLYHFDESKHGYALPFPFHSTKELMKASVVSIARHSVDPAEYDEFKMRLRDWKDRTEHLSHHKTGTGLRIHLDSEGQVNTGEKKEFVIVTGWDSLEEYRNLPPSMEDANGIQHKTWPECFERKMTQIVILE